MAAMAREFAQAGFLQRDAKRRRGRAHQQIVQETYSEASFRVKRILAQQPVNLDERLLLFFAFATGVLAYDALGLAEKLLRAYGAVNLTVFKLVEERRQVL